MKLSSGRLVDAEIKAIIETAEGTRLQVSYGLIAYEQLLAKLADVPTPAGPTPRQLSGEHLVQLQVGAKTRAS